MEMVFNYTVARQRRPSMERLLGNTFTFPTDRAFELAENSYHIAYVSDTKSNSYCGHMMEPMTCSCGEEEKEFAWVWSTPEEGGQAGNIVLDSERRQINFNPEYSSGTASVRGNQILPKNYQHYWEVKLTSAVYGTNIMIGVCTPNCNMKHGIYRFCSLIGRDEESWGYSYKGTTQHAGNVSRYGPQWGKGAIVGVHLDTWRGKLEFFLNREPLGIAFEGLKNKDLYPIVASTSAHSGMKLITSCMLPHSLQLLTSEIIFNKYANHTRNTHPKSLPVPPGLQKVIQNYMPFIKYVSVKAGSNRLEYIRWRESKRRHEEETSNMQGNKRLCTPSDFYSSSSYCDEICIPRKYNQSYSCFRVLFDTKTNGTASQNESENSSPSNSTQGNKNDVEEIFSYPSSSSTSSSSHHGESSSSKM